MIFKHDKEKLKIELSFKEKISILLRGCIILDRKSTYAFSSHLLKFISESTRLFGDAREHGVLKDEDNIFEDK